MKQKMLIKLILIIFSISIISGCDYNQPISSNIYYDLENSREISETFILNSPTYSYDGKNLEIISYETLRCEGCYLFTFRFNSTHQGYGNRQNQILPTTITPHKIEITIIEGKVNKAIIDQYWDELNQKEIETNSN